MYHERVVGRSRDMAKAKAEKAKAAEKTPVPTEDSEMYARRYLEEAARIMHNEAAMLSGPRYESAVQSVARTFETLRSAR
jgi:hypothetical protein